MRHQMGGTSRHGGEGVAGDRQRTNEVLARGVAIAALELVLVRIGDGMNQKIETAPFAFQAIKGGIEFGVVLDIAGKYDRGADRRRQRFEPFRLRLALIGEGDFSPLSGKRARDAPGDGMVVGHTHHQSAAALQQGGVSHVTSVSKWNANRV